GRKRRTPPREPRYATPVPRPLPAGAPVARAAARLPRQLEAPHPPAGLRAGFFYPLCQAALSAFGTKPDTLASPRGAQQPPLHGNGRQLDPFRVRDRQLSPLARRADAVRSCVPRLARGQRPPRRPAVDPLLRPARES